MENVISGIIVGLVMLLVNSCAVAAIAISLSRSDEE